MPVQKTTSALLQKLGGKLQAAHERHKMDDVVVGAFTSLPSGIKDGVARLVDIKFDTVKEGKQNAGQFYFYAAGVVVSPETFTDKEGKVHHIAGKRTSIIEPLYDTPTRSRKTFDDHWAQVLQELKKLGVATEEIEYDQVEAVCEALKSQELYFAFRTWGGEPRLDPQTKQMREGMVNETWEGLVPFDVDADPTADVVDDTEATPPPSRPIAKAPSSPAKPAATKPVQTPAPVAKPITSKPSTSKPTPTPAAKPTAKPGTKKPAPPPEPEPEPETFDEFGDLDSLAEQADAGDDAAQTQLTEYATNAGIDEEAINEAASWTELVALLKVGNAAPAADDAEAEAAEETTTGPDIEVGNVYKYRPINPKTRQPDKRMADVEVVKLHANGTVDVKNVATQVVYGKVPVDQLQEPTV